MVQPETRLERTAIFVAATGLALAGMYPGNNPDTFGHLAQGRQMAALGRVPELDSWSLLPGPTAWVNYEWLSDLGAYLLHANAGYAAVTLFKCGLLALTASTLVSLASRLAGARAALITSLSLLGAIPAIRVRLSDRPHVLGICLAALELLLLTRLLDAASWPRARRVTLVAALGLLHVVWVNAHGSHLLGPAISGSFLLLAPRDSRKGVAMVLGLQLLAACVSPYGPVIVLDAIAHVFDPRYRDLITEWRPWGADDPPWLQLGPVLHGVLLTLLAPRILRSGPAPRALLLVAVMLAIAAFRSLRFSAEFVLLTAPLVGVGVARAVDRIEARAFGWLAGAATVALAAAAALGARSLPPRLPLGLGMSHAGLPASSAAFLSRHARAPRVLASMQDSWYLMYASPRARFVVDGRAPLYGPEHLRRVSAAFSDLASFSTLVDAFKVDVVLAGHAMREEHALGSFARTRGFSLMLIEDQHALYVRGDALQPDGQASSPLFALQPTYALDWILQSDEGLRARMREELARLARYDGTAGYRSWVEGVLILHELRRGRGSDGFRWPRAPEDWRAYREAWPRIAHAAQVAGDVPVVSALHGYVAAVLCELDIAEVAVARAMSDRPSREPLLVQQELRLRRGEVDTVRDVVTRARSLPEGREDVWLAELATAIDVERRCPD